MTTIGRLSIMALIGTLPICLSHKMMFIGTKMLDDCKRLIDRLRATFPDAVAEIDTKSLTAQTFMVDVKYRGSFFVLDYGLQWGSGNLPLFAVANIDKEYAFNMSNDPQFVTLEEAEEYLFNLMAKLPAET